MKSRNFTRLVKKIRKDLKEDILWRYDNSEYWEPNIVEENIPNDFTEKEIAKIWKLLEESKEKI